MSDTFLLAITLTVGALFPIMNPFSTAPLLLSLTANDTLARRNDQALKACFFAYGILATFLLAGSAIVDFFGISIPGIRVAGGLIIAVNGFRMLFPSPPQPSAAAEAGGGGGADVAFTPLAMPSLAGPGSISVVLAAATSIRSNYPEQWLVIYVGVLAGMAVTLVLAYAILRAASGMVRILGPAGLDAMTRIFGFLLICIAMQFALTGIAEFFGLPTAG